LNRSERERRVRQLERWFDEENAEFDGDAFPSEVQDAWYANNRELGAWCPMGLSGRKGERLE
jgi:hypothetical protein